MTHTAPRRAGGFLEWSQQSHYSAGIVFASLVTKWYTSSSSRGPARSPSRSRSLFFFVSRPLFLYLDNLLLAGHLRSVYGRSAQVLMHYSSFFFFKKRLWSSFVFSSCRFPALSLLDDFLTGVDVPGNCKTALFTFGAQCGCVLVLQIGLRVSRSWLQSLAEDFFSVYANATGSGPALTHNYFILWGNQMGIRTRESQTGRKQKIFLHEDGQAVGQGPGEVVHRCFWGFSRPAWIKPWATWACSCFEQVIGPETSRGPLQPELWSYKPLCYLLCSMEVGEAAGPLYGRKEEKG